MCLRVTKLAPRLAEENQCRARRRGAQRICSCIAVAAFRLTFCNRFRGRLWVSPGSRGKGRDGASAIVFFVC